MEIRFCEHCHESIPDADFDSGRAVKVENRTFHVACGVRRSLTTHGPRTWVAFVLALLALGIGVYLLARGAGSREEPTTVPAPVEERIAKAAQDLDATLRAEFRQALEAERAESRRHLDAALAALRDDLAKSWADLTARLETEEGETRGAFAAASDRLARAEKEIQEINSWIREVAKRVNAEAYGPTEPAQPARPETPAPPEPDTASPPAEAPPAAPEAPAGGPEHEAKLKRWVERLKDPNEGVAFSATMELSQLKDLRAVAPLIEALQTRKANKDYFVRLGAAQALGELKAVDAVPALIDALDDSDDLVRQQADESLRLITEQDFGNAAGLPANERRKIQSQWKKWWKANEEALRQKRGQPKTTIAPPPR